MEFLLRYSRCDVMNKLANNQISRCRRWLNAPISCVVLPWIPRCIYWGLFSVFLLSGTKMIAVPPEESSKALDPSQLCPYLDPSQPVETRVEDLLSRLTLEEKISFLHADSKFTTAAIPRLHLPRRWLSDGPHGVREDIGPDTWAAAGRTDDFATAMPVGICLAATWNPELGFSEGSAIGEEARVRDKDIMLGPGVNILRTPLCGRNFEYLGEDPFLSGVMASGYVRGVQSHDVASCVKHFALNNQEFQRFTINVEVDEHVLREIYLPAFKTVVQSGGVLAVMGSYNQLRGEHCCHNDYYYSLYEWFNPLWLKDRPRYVAEHLTPQFKDVVTRYKPSIIFADGEWEMSSTDWKSEELLAWLFNESPCKDVVVVNDRWGKDCRHKNGGYWTTEYAAGLQDGSHPWEESRGMACSYGLNRAERFDDYKTSREFIFVLVDLVSRGGNLLLDMGPAADGTIPPLMEQRLLEIGDWLKVNGEAIYDTRFVGRSCQWTQGTRPKQEYGEFMIKYNLLNQVGQTPTNGVAVKQVFFTKKPDALYAITSGWPDKQLVIRNVRVPKDTVVTMLGVPGALKKVIHGNTLTIAMPDLGIDEAPCHYAYTFKIPGAQVLPEE